MEKMHPRARALLEQCALTPHPEGGYYRRVYRSEMSVAGPHGSRAAVTDIDYLLTAGQSSRFHRVRHDEIWHFYEGAPLRLVTCGAAGNDVVFQTLGGGWPPCYRCVVPAGTWQAAASCGDYTLVGCTVAPGFEFEDFEMLDPSDPLADLLKQRHPELAPFLGADSDRAESMGGAP